MSRNKKPKRYLFEEVLDFLKHNDTKIFNYKQLGAAMEINTEGERLELISVLESLKQQGFVVETETGKYQIKDSKQYLTGTIDFTTQGTAFVVFSETEDDIYIPQYKTRDALQGDLVKVILSQKRSGKRKEGEVVEVIKRAKTEFVGTIKINPKFAFVIPDSHKIHVDFFINSRDINHAEDGQKVKIKFKEWRSGDQNPTAVVDEVFGFPGVHKTEMNAIMAEYGLPEHFPEAVENAAKKISTTITQEEIAKRRDFRDITTFTIDPVDAKDFDDALSIQKLENGFWEVGVHIADVTHFLKVGNILDDEAVERATSVYLVDRVIPMLPEVLSNFACSLRPNEEKYCFSAVFQLDENADIHSQWFGKTVINSDKRFAYEDVQTIIETGEGEYKDEILLLDRLAKKLRAERTKRGSIFFDKAEVKFNLDDEGNPIGVFFKTQKDAHKLIEDFMLLANRTVAEFLGRGGKNDENPQHQNQKKKDDPKNLCVYRIHDVPSDEKMQELSAFVARFGYDMQLGGKQKSAQAINKLLVDVKNKKEQGMIEMLAVRSMPKAIYTTKNAGHYGLGFEYYTHFTSPIRRYPDVMVHRLLEARLNGTKYSTQEELELLCKHSSDQERTAAEAERASVKYKQVEFMKDKVGETFDAIISGVTEWGIYAEIIENRCEGMIKSRDLKGDHYTFDAEAYRYVGRNSGKVFALGDQVKIIVVDADLVKKQLNFRFAEMEGEVSHSDFGDKRSNFDRSKSRSKGSSSSRGGDKSSSSYGDKNKSRSGDNKNSGNKKRRR
ncbi:MAG: ribonuclease R [Bacteroidota bacterium]|nr:ribonuclease R [Bacteroidota bacterium]